jgi:hypothetical protein
MVNALPYSLLKPQVAQSRLQWMEEEQLCSDVPTATGSRFIEGGYRVQEAQVCSILLTQLVYFVALSRPQGGDFTNRRADRYEFLPKGSRAFGLPGVAAEPREYHTMT